jgi:beta-lactam-binding protein with PASTA domain
MPPLKRSNIPDVVGMPLLGAAQTVSEFGFTVGVRLATSDRHADGVVIAQQPPAGSVVPPGRQILLTVVQSV